MLWLCRLGQQSANTLSLTGKLALAVCAASRAFTWSRSSASCSMEKDSICMVYLCA
jgi:hypothetical protein